MADFRTKLLGLAAVATAFAGLSYGDSAITCAGTTSTNPTLRAEGETELVSDTTSTCTTTGGSTTGSVVLTLSAPVTSKAITGLTAGNSDAVILVNGTPTFGTISGTQVSFQNVAFPNGGFTLLAQNIRVNASASAAPQVTETILISYATVVGGSSNNLVIPATNVGFVLSTLGAPSLLPGGSFAGGTFTSQSYNTCVGNVISTLTGATAASNLSFTVVIKELVAGAFRTQTQEGGSNTTASAASGFGTASSATQIAVVLGNIPASASIYVPQSVTVNGTSLSILNSTAVTTPAAIAAAFPGTGAVLFTPTSTGVTVIYTTTAAASTGASNFNIPVYVTFAANSAGAQGPMTVLTSYSPFGAVTAPATAVPQFIASTATPVAASTIAICQTSLLFPFITNQLGFDTGIALANTSTDNLGLAGASSAKAQAGTCTMSFYGVGLPNPSTGINDPQGNLATATTHAFLLSALAPGFQGYAIASCPFLYAHGFAFIAFDLTKPDGITQGYLAEVLTPGRPTGAATPTPEAVTF